MILFEKKYLEVRQKYSAARRIFNSLLGVSSGDETLRLMFDILHEMLLHAKITYSEYSRTIPKLLKITCPHMSGLEKKFELHLSNG